MSQRPIHLVSDRWFAALNASVDSSETDWVLSASGATGLPEVDSLHDVILHCGTEKVRVTAVAVDTPSAGLDTITVERGYGGSTAAAHASAAAVAHYFYREYNNDLAERLAQLEYFLWSRVGAANGVVQDGGLIPQATGTPGMTVEVPAGSAMVNGQPVALRALYTSGTLIAPTGGDDRIDAIRIDQYGAISIVSGTPDASPVAPSVGSNYELIGLIYHRDGETSIKDADDATNGYLYTTGVNYL